MADQEKPFNTAAIVILMIVAGGSDIADLATVFFFPVPIIGQMVFLGNSLLVSPIVWAIIQLSFIIKTGVGRASLLAVVGGLGNIANIPGSETITTAIAIAIANSRVGTAAAAAGRRKIVKGKGAEKAAGRATGKEIEEAGGAKAEAGKRTRPSAERVREEMEEGGAQGERESEGGAGEKAGGEKIFGRELGEAPTPFEELERLTGPEGVLEDDKKNEVDLRKAA